jgi:hypothetical protein
MNESSREMCRDDEWSVLLRLVMKTSLSVAHELGLSPDSVLDCAARYLRFYDFAWFASAMHGASRAQYCCERTNEFSASEIAYITILAARLNNNRNALACVPTTSAPRVQHYDEVPAHAYEKVRAAIRALKDDVQRYFSHSGDSRSAIGDDVSEFATALLTIMPAGGGTESFKRATAAVLRVRFAIDYHSGLNNERRRGTDEHASHVELTSTQSA